MRSQGLQADEITYASSISACEKGRQWQRDLKLFGELCSPGPTAYVITSAATIDT